MPKYRVEMHDGRKFEVEADSPPTEEEILAHLGSDSGVPTPTSADMLTGRMGRDSNLKEGPAEPSMFDHGLHDILSSAAHPQSATDFAGLLLPRPLGESLNLGADAMRAGMKAHPEMTGISGRIRAGLTGVAEKWRGKPEPDLGSPFARGGTTPARAIPEAAAAETAAPEATLGAAERAGLEKQNYSPEMIAKIEQQLQRSAPPIRGTLRMAPTDAPPINVDTASLPESWKPLAEPSPLTGRNARVPTQDGLADFHPNSIQRIDPDAQFQYSQNKDAVAIQSSKGATAQNFGRSYVEQRLIATPGIHKQFPASGVDPSGKWFILAKDGDAFNRLVDELPDGLATAATEAPPISVDTASLPESWKPLAEPSPLQQPRVDIGAEKVGRGAGLTKQQVRDQTAPILGEAQGAASPILPEGALKRIIDAVRELPPGSQDRLDYVARATSGKTQWQVENIRRTLEHLGLIVPVAVGGDMVRSALIGRLRGDPKQE